MPFAFDPPANALLLSRADAMLPLPTAHPLLAQLHVKLVGGASRPGEPAITSLRVHGIVTPRLPGGEPTRA